MSKITAIVNQKGGVGKTTTALNLGYALSEEGKEVLLIDFDPQASLTTALGCNVDNKANIQTLMALAIEEKEMMEEEKYILNIKENLDLIPCSLDLAGIEMSLVRAKYCECFLKADFAINNLTIVEVNLNQELDLGRNNEEVIDEDECKAGEEQEFSEAIES